MPDATPLNALERAFAAASKSASARPDFYRLLRDSKLCFLMPYHPEMVGTEELKEGQPVPFVSWTGAAGKTLIPLFTARERIGEAVEKLGITEHYAVGQIQGLTIFQILATQPVEIVLNPRSGIGEGLFDDAFVRMIADGSLFSPLTSDGDTTLGIVILDPALYPTDIIQAAFEYMRPRPAFRAAWIFADASPEDINQPVPGHYCIGLYMDPKDNPLIQDLAVVIRTVSGPDRHCHYLVLDPSDPKSFKLMENVAAFFVAKDYPSKGRAFEDEPTDPPSPAG